MTGFFSKIFGKKAITANSPKALVEEVLGGLFKAGQFDVHFEVNEENGGETLAVEVYGEDEELLRAREGQLLDALQLFLTRVVQHQLKEERVNIQVDNAGFREQANQELTELAEKLKNIALDKGKPVYFRALPPRERKIIHQYLAEDTRIKSRSIGEGLYKKIKIYSVKGDINADADAEQM